jgi:hypothetical protein
MDDYLDTVEPVYNEHKAPLSRYQYLARCYMTMESAPNRYQLDRLVY